MKWINYKKRIFRRIGKSLSKISFFAVIICFAFYGMSMLGGTSSYFNDTTTVSGSTFQTGTFDLTARSGQSNFVSGADIMTPGKQVARDIYVGKTALSLPLKHNVDFEFVSGDADLCDQLDLKIWYDHHKEPGNRDMRLTYNGKLSALLDYGNVDFEIPHTDDQFDTNSSNGTEQWFYYDITLPSNTSDDFQGKVCNFKFVFNAWQNNLDYLSGGFTDKEELGSIIKTKYWNSPVVLNEFLPNAGEYPEFIEIYNQTDSDIDLNGFYIMADSKIPIDTTTTATYSGGSTIISANSWLVVTTSGNQINDTSGTITLYNQNDVVVDTYVYGASENNTNNTPGWTNNLIAYLPFDIDGSDKSGNSNNGTINGAIFAGGKINQGLSFDGTDDYVEVADSTSLDIVNEITVEGWIKPNAFSPSPTIAGKKLSYLLTIDTTRFPSFRLSMDGSTTVEATDNVALAVGNWYHTVGTYDGANIKLYINGVLVKTTPKTGTIYPNNEPVLIGAKDGWGGAGKKFTNGIVDEVKIYNRALDNAEILNHYNAISAGGAVPVDKSYARIPDGDSNWVDPMPTPGRPNVLEEQTEEIIQEDLEIESESINNDNVDSDEFITEIVEEIVNQSIQGEQIIEEQTEIIESIDDINLELITEPVTEPVVEVVDENTEETSTTGEVPVEATTEEIIIEQVLIEEVVEEVSAQEPIIEEPAIEEPVIEEPILSE